MDPRIREHAELIVDHSVNIEAGDAVVIDAHWVAQDLVLALNELIADRGGSVLRVAERTDKAARRAYLNAHDGEFELADHVLALIEETDVYIAVRGDANVTELSDVDPAVNSAYRAAQQPVMDERLSKRWVLTQYPALGNAQLAGMATAEYENYVWDAITKDWEAQGAHQAQMVERLDAADEVRIVSGESTDITMSVAGNPTKNDYAQNNLPGGEVFTAPVPDSVSGEVLFDLPLYYQGREITDAHLLFEDGVVVEHDAGENVDTLTEALNTDDGARRLGELGIGMNRDIDRFTYNMLFDEKMGDTVHLALGRAYGDTVGDGNEQNESAVHLDMIVDMSEDSRIELDGEVVQRNGTFVFEDEFET